MALSNLTKVQTVGIGSNIEVVGVITTGQFKSGTSNLHSSGVELTNLNVSGIATIGGSVSIGGTLTYQDVTNIDSVGLITARAGVNVSGGQLDVGSNIKLGNAGVITATDFKSTNFIQVLGSGGTSDKGLEVRSNSTQGTDTNQALRIRNNSNTDTFKVSYKGKVEATSFHGDGSNLSGVTQVGGATGVDFNDNVKARFGTGNDLEIYHNASHSIIHDNGTGDLKIIGDDVIIQANNDDTMAKFIEDGAVELYYDNAKTLSTFVNALHLFGNTSECNIDLKLSTGVRVGFLGFTNSGRVQINGAAGGAAYETYLEGNLNGSTKLFYDNSSKLYTTAHGCVVEDDNPYIVIKDNDTASGTGIVGWIEAQDSNGSSVWKIGNTHNDQNTLWINQRHNASTKFTGAVSGDTWEIYGNSGHFTPCTDNTFDIGESGRRVRNIYTADLHCSNRGSSNDVDGTWGDYTIQEGESDLFLINNRSGKKYKFNLTEVN